MRAQLAAIAVLSMLSRSAFAQLQTTTIGAGTELSYYVCDGCNPYPSPSYSYGVRNFWIGSYIRGFVGFNLSDVTDPIVSARLELYSFQLGADEYYPIDFYVNMDDPTGPARSRIVPAENLIGSWYLYDHRNVERGYSFDVSEIVGRSQDYIGFVLVEPVGSNTFYDSRLTITTAPEPSSVVLLVVGMIGLFGRRRSRSLSRCVR